MTELEYRDMANWVAALGGSRRSSHLRRGICFRTVFCCSNTAA